MVRVGEVERRVLEVLLELGWASPKKLAEVSGVEHSKVRRVLKTLRMKGLVLRVAPGLYIVNCRVACMAAGMCRGSGDS